MRRAWWRLFAAVGVLVLVAAACSNDGGGQTGATGGATGASGGASGATGQLGGTLVISNWDLYMPKNLIPDFEKATGVDVQLALHTTNEDIMGKITAQNGTGFDLVFVSGPFVQPLADQGWAAEIDHSKIPNLSNLYPQANELPYDPGNTHSVPYTWGTTGICYRSDLVSEAPTSWEMFHTPPPDLVGKMTMLGTDRWLLQPALLKLGYSINTTDQAQIDQATQWTEEAKDNLLGFDDTTFYTKLVSGEASAVQAWDGWCEYGRADEPKIDFVIPDEGSDVWTDTMVVLESSQNKDAAFAFIDFVLTAEIGKAVAEYTTYKVPNEPAMESLDPALIEQFPTLGITPEELLQQQGELSLGLDGTAMWVAAATQIKT